MEPNTEASTHHQPISEIQLIKQVGAWADKNFRDKRGAEWGILEEVGEAAHCVLKRRQLIRGFDEEAFFMEKFMDALADAMIYLADWSYVHSAVFQIGRGRIGDLHPNATDERRIVVHLMQGVSQMFAFPEVYLGDRIEPEPQGLYNMAAQRICNGIECWASAYDINLRLIVSTTWAKVGKRDWNKNPAAPTAEQA